MKCNKLKKLAVCACMLLAMTGLLAGCDGDSSGGNQAAKWPQKPVTFIVSHSAGGDTDYNARLLARLLEKELGQPFTVNNVTGANGSIALTQYKDAKPDGYTFIAVNTVALASNEATGLIDYGYQDFEPVAVYGRQCGENILVRSNAPYNTLGEFIEASKQEPGKLRLGVALGGAGYVASLIMEKKAGAKFAVVDSGDGSDRMTALIENHLDAAIIPYTLAKEHIAANKLKSLGTLLSERSPMLPAIPTAKEEGFPELTIDTYYGVLAPKGTDAAIVAKLNAAILKIVRENPEYKDAIAAYNYQSPWALNVAETSECLAKQRNNFMQYSKYLR